MLAVQNDALISSCCIVGELGKASRLVFVRCQPGSLQLSFEIFRADFDGEIIVAILAFRILASSIRDEERVTVAEPEESKIAWFEFCDVSILAL